MWSLIVILLLLAGCSSSDELAKCPILTKLEPKKDITAHEVAYIVSNLRGLPTGTICFTDKQWSELPIEIKRHFQKQKP